MKNRIVFKLQVMGDVFEFYLTGEPEHKEIFSFTLNQDVLALFYPSFIITYISGFRVIETFIA